ncbi:UvrD-helicase domain-containing protein [Hyphomicrobium sp.]|uniref:UvrD-helicase domain-containing protein n=1 Tax=Hyphomicrobium sp. TaxID=82 RepID=UPI002FDF8891
MRPYLSFSIDQLEAEFDRARTSNDKKALKVLAKELTFRKTPRARDLQDAVLAETRGKTEKEAPSHTAGNKSGGRSGSGCRPGGKKPTHSPTDEQQDALDCFGTRGSLKINAYAGSGKTSTLEMLAHSTTRRGQYIAFNRSIVRDARERFPDTVNCSTTHGLAFKAVMPHYGSTTKLTERINANQLAEILELKKWRIDKDHALVARSQGFLILETIRRFAQSADPEPSAVHVPRHGSLAAAPPETLKLVDEFAVAGAKHVWAKMVDADDAVPLGHDGYLKLWALSQPKILGDFILLDEAQDTNPVVLDVLSKQSAQIVYVGDKYQQIYEWRGAINAMEKIETDHAVRLSRSFRFGPAIADAANAILSLLGETKPLTGNPKIQSRIAEGAGGGTILARTNASTIGAVIEAIDTDRRPHLVGGNDELMKMLKGVQDLKEGQPSTVPDFFGFESWQEVVDFAKSGEGGHLQTFVNLVEGRGERQLMWALNRTVGPDEADVTISTAHKGKGQEWPSVRLLDDFLKSRATKPPTASDSEDKGFDPAELRLFYVAITRAKEVLDLPSTYHGLVGLESDSGQPSRPTEQVRQSFPQIVESATQVPPPGYWSRPENYTPPTVPPAEPASLPQKRKGLFGRFFG